MASTWMSTLKGTYRREMHPTFFTHLGKSLKSQEMRPPSERTISKNSTNPAFELACCRTLVGMRVRSRPLSRLENAPHLREVTFHCKAAG